METKTKYLLIVANTPSPNTRVLYEEVIKGASTPKAENIKIIARDPLKAVPEDVFKASAAIFGTTENLGYMSGALKDFFDRIYYPCLDIKQGMPFAFYIRAGQDGTGTRRAIESITKGLRWRIIQEPIILHGKYTISFKKKCKELGMSIALGLDAGLF